MPFVELDGSLLFLRRGPGRKRAKIAAVASLRIFFLREYNRYFPARELADHGVSAAGSVSAKTIHRMGNISVSHGLCGRQSLSAKPTTAFGWDH